MNGSVKNKKSLALIMIIAVAAAAVMGISISSCQKEETIKIGAILSLSGPGQYSGVEVRDGMLLVVDAINSRGGINGKEIELIIEDHKTNPEERKEAFDILDRIGEIRFGEYYDGYMLVFHFDGVYLMGDAKKYIGRVMSWTP